MMDRRSKLNEALATILGAIRLYVLGGAFFVVLGVVALDGVVSGNGLSEFRIGTVPIPKWQGAGATYLSVAIFCGVALVVLSLAILGRYLYHRKTIHFMRSRGIRDVNKDGKTDSFADKFWDDL